MSVEVLRALAEATTPGDWYCFRGEVLLLHENLITGRIACPPTTKDAAYIAAVNPAAILALLDEVDALRAAAKSA